MFFQMGSQDHVSKIAKERKTKLDGSSCNSSDRSAISSQIDWDRIYVDKKSSCLSDCFLLINENAAICSNIYKCGSDTWNA